MSDPILVMSRISKTFGPIQALRDVELTVWPGEVHALMGENGAGKSTLMKILSGAIQADSGGEIHIGDELVEIVSPAAARGLGVAVIYQELSLAPNLTASENIGLGHEARHFGLIDRKTTRRHSREVLEQLGAPFGPDVRVGHLSMAERQMVEIARAIAFNARILVMDEPTTALSSRETDKLFDLIRKLRAEGLAIIYISHRMAEVYELADRCSVLRDGSSIGTLSRDELDSETLVRMMVGRDIGDFYNKHRRPIDRSGTSRLAVRDLRDIERHGPFDFEIAAGEVVGIAGLVGSGRTECARLIYGADTAASGEIRIDGRPVAIEDPTSAIESGIVYLTEDRKGHGLFLDMTIADNIDMAVAAREAHRFGLRNRKAARKRADTMMERLGIRAPSAKTMVGGLSGGNQQKVLLARLLEVRPKVLILDEPTRGVDIGAKHDIYELIDELAKNGIAVLVISSELPEIVGLADRVLVMRDGQIAGEVIGEEISQERIIEIATGDYRDEKKRMAP